MTAKLILELNAECIENLQKEFGLSTSDDVKRFLTNVWRDNLKSVPSDRTEAIVKVYGNG